MQKERPLSPHLQVYKPQLTSVLSILHRGSGIFLSLGTPVLVYWLWTIASGAESYNEFKDCLNGWFSQLLMFAWSFALYYHLCNGIRHLFWDAGKGFEIETVNRTGMLVVIAAATLTLLTWIVAVTSGGAA